MFLYKFILKHEAIMNVNRYQDNITFMILLLRWKPLYLTFGLVVEMWQQMEAQRELCGWHLPLIARKAYGIYSPGRLFSLYFRVNSYYSLV